MSSIQYAYLGKPGAMEQLFIPRRGWEAPPSLGDSAHTLLSGGTAVTRVLNPKRRWPIAADVPTDIADIILGFYQGLYGIAPFVFVDPTVRNVLRLDPSTCGIRTQAGHGWVASGGTLAAAATGGPTGIRNTGVLTWTALSASKTLQPGSVANTADTTLAPVYLPGEPVSVSVYAKASAAHTASLQLAGYSSAGAVVSSSIAASMPLTTAWTRYTASAPANAAALASSLFVLPRIVLGATGIPTSVSIAAVQVEYADAVSTWQPGFGSPRVVVAAPPGRTVNLPNWRAHTLELAEV